MVAGAGGGVALVSDTHLRRCGYLAFRRAYLAFRRGYPLCSLVGPLASRPQNTAKTLQVAARGEGVGDTNRGGITHEQRWYRSRAEVVSLTSRGGIPHEQGLDGRVVAPAGATVWRRAHRLCRWDIDDIAADDWATEIEDRQTS